VDKCPVSVENSLRLGITLRIRGRLKFESPLVMAEVREEQREFGPNNRDGGGAEKEIAGSCQVIHSRFCRENQMWEQQPPDTHTEKGYTPRHGHKNPGRILIHISTATTTTTKIDINKETITNV
jgi:hypothetical protein